MRDRQRWLRAYNFGMCQEIQRRHEANIQELRQEFPLFFLENGKFDKVYFIVNKFHEKTIQGNPK